MVLVEGIETADEAYLALEADADFAQGYLFGRPHPLLGEKTEGRTAVNEIWKTFDAHWHLDRQSQKEVLAPYQNAIGYASTLLAAGVPMPEACASFFELPDTCFCYLLDEHGRQIGVNLWGGRARPGADPRLTPLTDTRGARWSLPLFSPRARMLRQGAGYAPYHRFPAPVCASPSRSVSGTRTGRSYCAATYAGASKSNNERIKTVQIRPNLPCLRHHERAATGQPCHPELNIK